MKSTTRLTSTHMRKVFYRKLNSFAFIRQLWHATICTHWYHFAERVVAVNALKLFPLPNPHYLSSIKLKCPEVHFAAQIEISNWTESEKSTHEDNFLRFSECMWKQIGGDQSGYDDYDDRNTMKNRSYSSVIISLVIGWTALDGNAHNRISMRKALSSEHATETCYARCMHSVHIGQRQIKSIRFRPNEVNIRLHTYTAHTDAIHFCTQSNETKTPVEQIRL